MTYSLQLFFQTGLKPFKTIEQLLSLNFDLIKMTTTAQKHPNTLNVKN